jgi:ubiquinone/menaquinone biosynthesis C-methylase UbiE
MPTWLEHWERGETGWDAGAASPTLRALVDADRLPQGRALVPGAGSGYDVLALATAQRTVLGVDLSPIAVKRFKDLRSEAGVGADRASMLVADFFDPDAPLPDAHFDLVWDYTFFCAIDPPRRAEWVERMDRLLAPNGELWMLLFPVRSIRPDGGPPHPIPPELVTEALAPRFVPVSLEPATQSHPAREGNEWVACFKRASG